MAKIGLPKGSGNRLKVREKSVKSQGILKWISSGNLEEYLAHIEIGWNSQKASDAFEMRAFLHMY